MTELLQINNNDRILTVNNLSLTFNNILILDNINFSVNAGEYVSVIGRNGAGKSTLIKAIAGLNNTYSGNISLLNQDIKNIKPKHKSNPINANLIAYLPQVKSLDRNFPAKLIELVASGITNSWNWKITSEIKERSIEVLKKFKIDHLYNRNLNTLSGGELQKAYLARAIARKPILFLFDEPASGVDSNAESDLILFMEEYKNNNNVAMVSVTHDWNTAFHHSDKVLMLNIKQFCFDVPEIAFNNENLRNIYGHSKHDHNFHFQGGFNA